MVGDSKVTLTLSNGPSTVKVVKSAQVLAEQAANAPAVVGVTGELAATGRAQSSQSTFDRHQFRLRSLWPEGGAIAKLRWHGRGPTSASEELFVTEGTSDTDLARGPGWYEGTARPADDGNIAIAGHRTGFGAPFGDLNRMQAGDALTLTTSRGDVRTFRVAKKMLVDPDATWVLGPDVLRDGSNTLTLTTCDPPGINTKRLIVVARETWQ